MFCTSMGHIMYYNAHLRNLTSIVQIISRKIGYWTALEVLDGISCKKHSAGRRNMEQLSVPKPLEGCNIP